MKKPVNIVDKAMEIARSVRRVPKKSAKKKAKKPALVVMDMVQDVEQDIPIANALRLARGGGGGADSGQAANRPSSGGGPGGGMMGGSGSGGPSRTAPSTSTGGDKGGKGGVGTGNSGVGGDKGGKGGAGAGAGAGAGGGGGPSRGPTDQPSRTEPSKATKPPETKTSVSPAAREPTGYSRPAGYGTAPSGVYGPRMGSDVVSTAPSTFSTENAMRKIAEGSSIVGGNLPKAPEPKIQDQVPSTTVKLEQTPTISRNAYDAYTPSESDIFAGANSPLAGGGLDSYNRDTYQSLQTPSQQAAINAANQAAADARFVSSDVSAPVPSSGNVSTLTRSAIPAGAPVSPTYVAGDPRVNYAQPAYSTTVSGTPSYLDSNTNYPTVLTSNYAKPNVGVSTLANTTGLAGVNYGNLDQPGYGYTQVSRAVTPPSDSKQYGERLVSYNGRTYEVSPQKMARMTPEDQAEIAAYNQQVSYNPPVGPITSGYPATSTYVAPVAASQPTEINIPGGDLPVGPRINNVATSYPPSSTYVAQYQPSPAKVSNSPPTRTPLPGYDVQTASVDESAGPYDYTEPTNDIYPSGVNDLGQERGGRFTPEQRAAYLASIESSRGGEGPTGPAQPPPPAAPLPPPPEPYKPVARQPYVYRDYLSENYGTPLPPPSTSIADFNAYNQRYMNRGGRIGGSAEAALRIARSKLL